MTRSSPREATLPMGGGTTLRHDEHARTAAARDDGGEPQRYGAVRCAATRAGPWRASPVNLSFGILVVASSLSTAEAVVENRWNVGADGQSCDTAGLPSRLQLLEYYSS